MDLEADLLYTGRVHQGYVLVKYELSTPNINDVMADYFVILTSVSLLSDGLRYHYTE